MPGCPRQSHSCKGESLLSRPKISDPVLPAKYTEFQEQSFIHNALCLYWDAHHMPEPVEYFTVREAFQFFHDATGISKTELAVRLGILPSYLRTIEAGTRIVMPSNYVQLKELAKSYGLPILVKFFDDCEFKAINAQKATTSRKMKHATSGAMPNWRDMMGE